MDPKRQQQLAMPTVEVYLAIEEQILINIAKALKDDKSLLEDNVYSWQVQQLAKLGSLTQANIITIAKQSGLAIDEVSKMLEKVGYESVDEIESDLQKAVQMGLLVKPPSILQSTMLSDVLLTYQMQAKNTFNLVNTTMLQQSQQIYLDIVNQTVGKVLAGVSTPQQALREMAQKWAEKGVPALIDKKGRQWSTEAYLNMVTRSLSNNVANEMQFARMEDYGADLIEVSSHIGARPRCAPFQGKIYSRSGKSKKYPPFSSTSYGEPAGLLGINCGHYIIPYIEGLSRRTFHPYNKKENDEAYKQSQKQRYLEREIRKAKRELNMMQALGDEKGIKQAKEKIRQKQANMRAFIKETGRTRRYEREQITPLSKQDAQDQHQRMMDKVKQEIRNKIANGEISTKINPEKQARHMLGDPAYEAYKQKLSKKGIYGPSYLTISQEEAQELVNKYAGTGELSVNNNLQFENKEKILQNDKQIGYYVDSDGNHILTNVFDIRYSKTGVHIFPSKGRKS
ncbi:phage minor capsid protein [Bacillus smithii]|uniref:phage minor capsid protein n=1 Tax=Bacillus smithii TaxID=1479 RepID=UPI003D209C9B